MVENTTQQKLDYLISQKVVELQNIKWGSGFRDVVIIGVKNFNIIRREALIKLWKKLFHCYI